MVLSLKSQGTQKKRISRVHLYFSPYSFDKIIDIEIMLTHFIWACLDSVSAELISFLHAVNQKHIVRDVWLRRIVQAKE